MSETARVATGIRRAALVRVALVQYREPMMTTPAARPLGDPAARESGGTESTKVSVAHGWWSVGLALGSAVVFWIVGTLVAITIMAIFGGTLDQDGQSVNAVVGVVIRLLALALAIGAMVLGVTSLVRAATQAGRSGRAAAIALGGIGIALSAVMGWLLLATFL